MKVFIIAAITLDGFLARDRDDFVMDWTSKEDVQRFVTLTKEAGVMIMGSRTFETTIKAGRRLPGRKMVVYTSRPEEFTHARTDPTEATQEDPAALVSRLQTEGYRSVAICGGQHINTLFMKSGMVTDIYLTIEPVLFGAGLSLFSEEIEAKLTLQASERLGENALSLHYTLTHS